MNDQQTIADLQSRLIQRTEQATATAYRDAETIRGLREQLRGAPTPLEVSARIATRLFSNGFGDQGERLEIKQAIGYEKERSLGGWCYLAALAEITAVLEESAEPSHRPSYRA